MWPGHNSNASWHKTCHAGHCWVVSCRRMCCGVSLMPVFYDCVTENIGHVTKPAPIARTIGVVELKPLTGTYSSKSWDTIHSLTSVSTNFDGFSCNLKQQNFTKFARRILFTIEVCTWHCACVAVDFQIFNISTVSEPLATCYPHIYIKLMWGVIAVFPFVSFTYWINRT